MKSFLFSFALLVTVSASDAVKSEKEQAIALVNDAVIYVKTNGEQKALIELNKATGRFVKSELYVFAYDLTGTIKAHPKNAALVGKNLLEAPDVNGKYFRKEILEKAKSPAGKGWVDYMYKNPESKKVEAKTTFILKAGGLVLCCGIYK